MAIYQFYRFAASLLLIGETILLFKVLKEFVDCPQFLNFIDFYTPFPILSFVLLLLLPVYVSQATFYAIISTFSSVQPAIEERRFMQAQLTRAMHQRRAPVQRIYTRICLTTVSQRLYHPDACFPLTIYHLSCERDLSRLINK